MEKLRLTIDRDACAGHGMCYGIAPALIDPDEQGDPLIPDRSLRDDETHSARAAVAACPERALTITNSPVQ